MEKLVTFATMALATTTLVGCDGRQQAETPWIVDRFDDVKVIRYEVPGFDSLSLREKELVYYLAEAAKSGRDILFDQNFRLNLPIRRTLETVYEHYRGDRTDAQWLAPRKVPQEGVVRQRNPTTTIRTTSSCPSSARSTCVAAIAAIPAERFGELAEMRDECAPPSSIRSSIPSRLNQKAGDDLLLTSAGNYYRGVTQAEAERFYADMAAADAGNPEPVSYGLNSQLVKDPETGLLHERTWKVGGMYSPAIERIVYWLDKAAAVAEEPQRTTIATLADYYRTGDRKLFDRYNILWVKDTVSNVDFVNGFIEDYGDPLGRKASWEGNVNFMDREACHRTEVISKTPSGSRTIRPWIRPIRRSRCAACRPRSSRWPCSAATATPRPPSASTCPTPTGSARSTARSR